MIAHASLMPKASRALRRRGYDMVDLTPQRILAIILVIGGLLCSTPWGQPASPGRPMHPLHIALHDGFQGHTVVITVDGREVYNQSSVTTNLAISRADAFDVQVASNTVRIEVSVEPGGRKGSTEVDVTQYPFVAVSLERDGSIAFQPSTQLFRYM
jgi:hypothetical protein